MSAPANPTGGDKLVETTAMLVQERSIFEQGSPGRTGASLPKLDVPEQGPDVPAALLRKTPPGLPELSEVEVTRHFTRLSRWNYAVDVGMYPLGSCTMKYNPKINERAARLHGLSKIHPYQPESTVQGALAIMWELEQALREISGFARVTLQPAAGAHGELCGLMMIRAYHLDRGQDRRTVLIPDTAHGTNPASCTLSGLRTVPVKTGPDGILTVDAVKALCNDDLAAIMITNPNTIGLFERNIAAIAEVVHAAGGLVYMDGANLNALMGKFRPGDAGVDVMHFNLHKTFVTPHGGGGPGSGPVGVSAAVTPFLPVPLVEKHEHGYRFEHARPKSIGRMRSFYGNFAMLVRAYAYIKEMGAPGLTKATEMAVLNANYLRARLEGAFPVAFAGPCMHEVVLSDKQLKKETGVQTMDVAKRL
ncbi:MAG: aminomethyl-transferring glycine dehydrogenase subunit GcvPB, partial [Deltaproteobacteria bacterium]|nr:aminomethyl-transferring glycine dehydrogenase subunit GcvPB [Deltaproteobacteria bacterium]